MSRFAAFRLFFICLPNTHLGVSNIQSVNTHEAKCHKHYVSDDNLSFFKCYFIHTEVCKSLRQTHRLVDPSTKALKRR